MDESDRHSDSEESEDVARLVGLLKRLQTDNVELRRNFESLKGLHLQLNDDHKQLQGRYNALYEERVTVERQYQALCESWRVELEEKQKQFEHVKAQILGPRDLELLKLTMMEKVEVPFRAKCDMLAREAEAAQQSFVRQRREYEELQAKHKTLELHSQRDRENLIAEYTSTVNELKDRLAAQNQNQVKMLAAEAKSKALEREKAELSYQLGKLKEEIEDLRQAKERANVEKGSVELRVERKVKSIQAEELQLSGLVETLTRKNRHLQKELAEANRANEEVFDQRLRLQAAQAALQSQLDSLRRQHASEQQAQEEQHLAAARALEDKLLLLRDELHDKERQKAEMHITHQEQVTQLVNGHSLRVEELEKEHAARLRELKEQSAELAARVAALQDSLSESRRKADDLQHKAKRDAEGTQRQLERLQTQLAEAQRAAVAKEVEVSELRNQMDQAKADVMRLELANKHLEQRRDDLQAQVGKLSVEAHELNEAKRAIGQACDDLKSQLEQQKATHSEQLEQQRQSFATEKSATTKRYQAALKDLTAKHEADVKKLRRRVKGAERSAQSLGNEVAELKLRSELELISGYIPDTAAGRDVWVGGLHAGAQPYLPRPQLEGGGRLPTALMQSGGRPDDASLEAEIAALRQRQQDYLKAAQMQ